MIYDLVFLASASSGWRVTMRSIFFSSSSFNWFPLNSEKTGVKESLANSRFWSQFNLRAPCFVSKSRFTEFRRFWNAGGTKGVVDGVLVRETMSCESREFPTFEKFCKKAWDQIEKKICNLDGEMWSQRICQVHNPKFQFDQMINFSLVNYSWECDPDTWEGEEQMSPRQRRA